MNLVDLPKTSQLGPAFLVISLAIALLPIKFYSILSRVFSLKVATFCSNPFEHVYVVLSY